MESLNLLQLGHLEAASRLLVDVLEDLFEAQCPASLRAASALIDRVALLIHLNDGLFQVLGPI